MKYKIFLWSILVMLISTCLGFLFIFIRGIKANLIFGLWGMIIGIVSSRMDRKINEANK
jgi:hypothetical protein